MMRRRLLDVLICPACGHFPLKLEVASEEEVPWEPGDLKKPICERYCALNEGPLPEDPSQCVQCMSRDVIAGSLVCEACGKRYGISEGVPDLLLIK
ncbi:MAG TPA: Trm112 family protein [Candidatus Korarchaeota archaeon]|nr:Trm112 family protein [Candidatus Korarchaeota archaeon]